MRRSPRRWTFRLERCAAGCRGLTSVSGRCWSICWRNEAMAVPDQRSLERLLDAAGQAVRPTHPGWRTLPQRLARTKQLSRRPTWWLGPLSIASAALVLTIWLGKFTAPTLAEGPIEVRPVDVSLTILSVSETEGETLYMPILQKLGTHFMPPPNLPMIAGAMPPSSGRMDRVFQPERA